MLSVEESLGKVKLLYEVFPKLSAMTFPSTFTLTQEYSLKNPEYILVSKVSAIESLFPIVVKSIHFDTEAICKTFAKASDSVW